MDPAQNNPGAWYRLSLIQFPVLQGDSPQSSAKAGRVHLLYALSFFKVSPFSPLLPVQAFTRSIGCDKHLAVAYFQRGTVFYRRQK